MNYKSLFIACISLFILSCDQSSLPDLKGRYQGWKTVNGESFQVVAEIPAFQSSDDNSYFLKFELAQTLGSAKVEKWGIRITEKGDIWLHSSFLKSEVTQLKLEGSCAESLSKELAKELAKETVRLCLGDGHLKLEVSGLLSEKTVELTRDDFLPPLHRTDAGKIYSLDELLGRARFFNYTTMQAAEKLIRAKEDIGRKKWGLLPRFNIKIVIEFFADGPLSLLDSLGFVAPFLFPTNWFKWKEADLLFRAEQRSYASLRGNQMLSVEQLFYVIHRDLQVRSYLLSHLDWLKKIQKGIEMEERERKLPTGSSDFFQLSILPLEEDRLQFENLIQMEIAELSHAVALPPLDGISGLSPVTLPDLSEAPRLDPKHFFRDAQLKSLEVEALKNLLSVALWIKEERKWGFIDPESDDAAGFDFGHTMRIARSHENEIRKKVEEVHSSIEKQSGGIAQANNSTIDLYLVSGEEIKKLKFAFDYLVRRHLSGDHTLDEWEYLKGLAELANKRLSAEIKRLNLIHDYLITQAKYQRLLLLGHYRDLMAVLP
jgi:hypothetical protein